MTELPVHPTESRDDLAEAVAALEARVAALEQEVGRRKPTPAAPVDAAPLEADAVASAPARSGAQLPTLGSAFLMLAGAFLLRALTDSGILNARLGIASGLTYVLALLFLTDRAAASGRRGQAMWFGLSTVLVAYPFIWETSAQLGLLSTGWAAAVAALVTVLAVGVAVRQRLHSLAWVMLVAALLTLAGLYWVTGELVLFGWMILALGAGTVWLGYLRNWQGARWLAASAANFLVFLTIMLAARPAGQLPDYPRPSREATLLLALALPVVYLGSFAVRILRQHREAGAFEILQSVACLVAGHLGAIYLLQTAGRSHAALGVTTLLGAGACTAVAFTFGRRHQGRSLDFFYYAWLGLLLTYLGTALVVPGRWLPYLWGGLGVATAIAGGRFDRWTLRMHCAVYLTGAAVMTGMPAMVVDAFAAPASSAWRRLAGPGLTVWLLAAVCYVLLVTTQRGRQMLAWQRLPRFLLAGLVLVGAGSLLVGALAGWLTGAVAGSEAAIVAVVRTAVLALTAVALAAIARRPLLAELAWFVNPLLVLAGLKLLVEDLGRGSPISLFFGFACFGIALIVAPRLRRQEASRHT